MPAGSPFNSGTTAPLPPPVAPSPININQGQMVPNGYTGPIVGGGQTTSPSGSSPFPWMQSAPPNTVPYANPTTPPNPFQLMQDPPNTVPYANQNQSSSSDPNSQFQTSLGQNFYQNAINNLSSLTMPDQASLAQEANQQAALKYDPLIQQLQNSLGSAQTNEKNASNQIGSLYTSLGQALAAQIPNITNQYSQAEARSQQNYQNLQNQINSNYQNAKNQQAMELQQLGIQAALPQSEQKLNADQQYLGNQAAVNGQALNDAMRLMGQGQADWTQRASQIAPEQGANIQANLATQLLNLQNQINQEIAGYKGQEGAAASSLLSQLTSQAQKDYNAQQTQSLDQSYKLAELMKLTNPGAFGVAPKAPTAAKYKGVSGVQNYFLDNSQTADPTQMNNDFMGFVGSSDLANLTGPGGSGSPTLETAYQGLQQYLQQNDPGVLSDPQSLAELYNALAIKYGKY